MADLKRDLKGWKVAYEPDTFFIGAEHPRGGKKSIAEVVHPDREVRAALGEIMAQAIREAVDG